MMYIQSMLYASILYVHIRMYPFNQYGMLQQCRLCTHSMNVVISMGCMLPCELNCTHIHTDCTVRNKRRNDVRCVLFSYARVRNTIRDYYQHTNDRIYAHDHRKVRMDSVMTQDSANQRQRLCHESKTALVGRDLHKGQ